MENTRKTSQFTLRLVQAPTIGEIGSVRLVVGPFKEDSIRRTNDQIDRTDVCENQLYHVSWLPDAAALSLPLSLFRVSCYQELDETPWNLLANRNLIESLYRGEQSSAGFNGSPGGEEVTSKRETGKLFVAGES